MLKMEGCGRLQNDPNFTKYCKMSSVRYVLWSLAILPEMYGSLIDTVSFSAEVNPLGLNHDTAEGQDGCCRTPEMAVDVIQPIIWHLP